MTDENVEENYALEQAKAQYSSICEMVAALEVDYDRLEELKEELEDMEYDFKESDDARQAAVRRGDVTACGAYTTECYIVQCAIDKWKETNGGEFRELQEAACDCENQDAARDRIQEDPLSVEVRSGWYNPCSPEDTPPPEEAMILLCCGGPDVRLIIDLDESAQPVAARMYYQDWGTPRTEYVVPDEGILLQYCNQFYFGG